MNITAGTTVYTRNAKDIDGTESAEVVVKVTKTQIVLNSGDRYGIETLVRIGSGATSKMGPGLRKLTRAEGSPKVDQADVDETAKRFNHTNARDEAYNHEEHAAHLKADGLIFIPCDGLDQFLDAVGTSYYPEWAKEASTGVAGYPLHRGVRWIAVAAEQVEQGRKFADEIAARYTK